MKIETDDIRGEPLLIFERPSEGFRVIGIDGSRWDLRLKEGALRIHADSRTGGGILVEPVASNVVDLRNKMPLLRTKAGTDARDFSEENEGNQDDG